MSQFITTASVCNMMIIYPENI